MYRYIQKNIFHELFLYVYTAKNQLFQKKEEANDIQRSHNNYFLFTTSEDIYIFMRFGENKIALK